MKRGRDAIPIAFDDGEAYEGFMGPWSRAAGAAFLDWLDPPRDARWLEVGCGTGAFTSVVLHTCAPARIDAIDPAAALLAGARRRLADPRIRFRLGDARSLPYTAGSFDVVTSALVLNFIGDRARALGEMRRTARPGATVSAYVWDFAGRRAPNSCLALGLEALGLQTPGVPGAASSSLGALAEVFEAAGLKSVAVKGYDVGMEFDDFDSFWQAQTPGFSPLAKAIAALTPDTLRSLQALVRARTVRKDGRFSWSARANAVKARAP